MKRLIWLVCLSLDIVSTSAQEITRQDADSMLRALNKSKPTIDRIDLLLSLAQFHIFKPGENQIDFDSAMVYINEARALNRSVKSTSASGYLLLTESYLAREKGQKDEGKKMAEEAVVLLKTGSNKDYLGQAYFELSMYYVYSDSQQRFQRLSLVKKAIDAFQQTGNLKRNAISLEMLGDLYIETGNNYDNAIQVLKQALVIYDSIKYQKLQGVYVLLGSSNRSKGDYGQALFYLLRALKTAQTLNDTTMQLCQIYNQMALVYQNIDRFDMAVKYLNKALEISKKYNDDYAMGMLSLNIASIYLSLNQPAQSLSVLDGIPKTYRQARNISLQYLRSYLQLEQYDNARPYRDTILRLANKKLVAEGSRSNIYRAVASYFFFTKQYSESRYYLTKSIDIGKRINYERGRIQSLHLLYMLDSAEGKFRSAFNHLLSFKTKMDSISSERTVRQFQVLGVEYELGMKEDSIKLRDKDISLLTQTNNLQKANLQQASLIKNVTVAGIVLALIFIGLLYRQYRQKQKSNNVITRKNDQLQHLLGEKEHLLSEKEWLLKEIHHRVKNNLQIVMSLLNSQSAFIDNPYALTAIHDSQHRVHAMSLIHQKLYSSENVSIIDMSLYIRELVSYLSESFNTGQRIRFEYNIEMIEMDVSEAVPLGLILNEAITNAIKYAFPEERSGIISITFSIIPSGQYLLRIADDGVGLHPNYNFKKPGSLGMSLMAGLAEDLNGNISIENDHGSVITVTFAYDRSIKVHAMPTSPFVSSN